MDMEIINILNSLMARMHTNYFHLDKGSHQINEWMIWFHNHETRWIGNPQRAGNDQVLHPVIGQLNTVIPPIACPWSGVQIFRITRLPQWVTWLATSAQRLTLLAVVRSKQLCPAPRPWRHYATPWWCHLRNITGFRNLVLAMLSDVKSSGK